MSHVLLDGQSKFTTDTTMVRVLSEEIDDLVFS